MASQAEYLDEPRFNQTFVLPANPSLGRNRPFRIKYADYGYGYRGSGYEERENSAVLLFFGSLLASRLVHVAKDELARKLNVRIINIDRPGIGGTDSAETSDAMRIWREAIPALLAHLRIQYVSVACHSGGTVWALDMLLHHPEILHPSRPYLAIGGPWILPSHTGRTALSMVQLLPTSVINKTDKLAKLINNHVGPALGASVGFSLALVAKLGPTTAFKGHEDAEEHGHDRAPEGARFEEDLWPKVIARIYAEGVRGIGSEAVLLMHKAADAAGSGWSDWGDYDQLVPRLAEALRAAGRRLRLDVFYAEKDMMIGHGRESKGARWFDSCWEQTRCADVVQYRSTTVMGADHDGIWNLRWGMMQEVFLNARGTLD